MQTYSGAPQRNTSAPVGRSTKAPVDSTAPKMGVKAPEKCGYNKGLEDGSAAVKPRPGFNSGGVIAGKV